MLLGELPIIADPLCTLAGWLDLPFWLSLMYMAIGKFFTVCRDDLAVVVGAGWILTKAGVLVILTNKPTLNNISQCRCNQ